MYRLRYLPLFFLILVGCRDAAPPPSSKVDELLDLISERLAPMSDVAKAKVYLGLPVDDAKREDAILQAAEVDAAKSGLDVAFVRTFFTNQFDAAKKLQTQEMANAARPEPTEEGLKQAGKKLEEARAKISSVNVKMLTALFHLKNIPVAERKKLVEASYNAKLAAYDQDIRAAAVAVLLSEQSP